MAPGWQGKQSWVLSLYRESIQAHAAGRGPEGAGYDHGGRGSSRGDRDSSLQPGIIHTFYQGSALRRGLGELLDLGHQLRKGRDPD